MAVAVKNPPDARTASPLDRLQVVSLIGVVYVLGCLGVVFAFIPYVWGVLWPGSSFGSMSMLALVMLGAAIGLILVGGRLQGPKPKLRVRAGVFVGLLFVLFAMLLTRWVSLWIEYWVFYDRWFGDSGPMIGAILTIIAGAGFLFLFGRWFFRPGFEHTLERIEGQGWFHAHAYKPQQGQKVRRGTILGILLIVGAGIYTMISHNLLARGSENWSIAIPFTGRAKDIQPNDALHDERHDQEIRKKFPGWHEHGVPVYEFRKYADEYDPARFVRIDTVVDIQVRDSAGKTHTFAKDDIIPKSDIIELKKNLDSDEEKDKLLDTEEVRKLKDSSKHAVVVPVDPPRYRIELASITLLPHVRFTLPFLLMALTIWLAWRIVNLPVFADFLIATEAELNKVSWTTRKKLYQDTVVVLATMVLLAILLFAMDQVWLHLLSWKRIGVIQQNEDTTQQTTKGEKPLW